MSTYMYTKSDIENLIKRDLENRLGLEEGSLDNHYNFQLASFPDGSSSVILSDIDSDAVPEININQGEELEEPVVDLSDDLPLNNHQGDSDPLPAYQEDESPPPHGETTNRFEIEEMINWAIENNRMLEMVYLKTSGGVNERSARIITPVWTDGSYVRTILHATMREDTQSVEYSSPDDNRRTFIANLIQRVRPANL